MSMDNKLRVGFFLSPKIGLVGVPETLNLFNWPKNAQNDISYHCIYSLIPLVVN